MMLHEPADSGSDDICSAAWEGGLVGCSICNILKVATHKLTQTVQGGGRVEHRHADLGDDAGNDGGLALAAALGDHGEDDALEEGAGLVEGLLQRIVEMYIELARLADVILHAGKQDRIEKLLGDVGFAGDEEARGRVDAVGGPVFGAGDGE